MGAQPSTWVAEQHGIRQRWRYIRMGQATAGARRLHPNVEDEAAIERGWWDKGTHNGQMGQEAEECSATGSVLCIMGCPVDAWPTHQDQGLGLR